MECTIEHVLVRFGDKSSSDSEASKITSLCDMNLEPKYNDNSILLKYLL